MKNSILFQGLVAASVAFAAPAYAQSENVAMTPAEIAQWKENVLKDTSNQNRVINDSVRTVIAPEQKTIETICTTVKLKRPVFSQPYYLQKTDEKCLSKKQEPIIQKCSANFTFATRTEEDKQAVVSSRPAYLSCLNEESQKAYGVDFSYRLPRSTFVIPAQP